MQANTQPTLSDPSSRGRDRALARELKRELRAAGCFAPAIAHQVCHMIFVTAIYAGAWLLLLADPGPALRVAALLLLAFASVQAGFIAHEAGHGAITRRRGIAVAIGQFFNTFLTALCYSHFQKIHSCHHAHCNERERDVDMHSKLFSLYPEAVAQNDSWPGRLITRHQGWLIWPLISLQGFSLKLDSLRTLREKPAATRVDQVMLGGHLLLWSTAPVAMLGAVDALLNYLLMTWFIGPYLGTVFLVNHIGTHVVGPGETLAPFTQRLVTTRNLGDSLPEDFFFGGLNNHIEHHLFPTIPSSRLRKARVVTRAFCRRNGLCYRESSWFQAAARVSAYLRQLSRQPGPAAETGAAR